MNVEKFYTFVHIHFSFLNMVLTCSLYVFSRATFTSTGTIDSDINERQYFLDYVVELL